MKKSLQTRDDILRCLATGPKAQGQIMQETGLGRGASRFHLRALRRDGKVRLTGDRRSSLWHLAEGVEVVRKARKKSSAKKANGHTVTNTRPAKTNGQVETAVAELREVIGRKQAEIDNLNQALVILEASL